MTQSLVQANFSLGGWGKRHTNPSLQSRSQQAADWKWISRFTTLRPLLWTVPECWIPLMGLKEVQQPWGKPQNRGSGENLRHQLHNAAEYPSMASHYPQDEVKCSSHQKQPSTCPTSSFMFNNLVPISVATQTSQMLFVCLKCSSISFHPHIFLVSSSLSFCLNLNCIIFSLNLNNFP